jgi:phosphocarrier protein
MECQITVGPGVGLHARPAARFVQAVIESGERVTIRRPSGPPVAAGSILSVLSLGIGGGEQVVLTVDGEAASAPDGSCICLGPQLRNRRRHPPDRRARSSAERRLRSPM